MRARLALVALLAGCSLIKTNVSTPETRRQESEALARQAEKDREADLAAQKALEPKQPRPDDGETIVQNIEAARRELATGVTPGRAIAFADRVREAEATTPARDGRLDVPKLWIEATGPLERAASDGPSSAAFTALVDIPGSPGRDAAVVRACPRVRPAIADDALAAFMHACMVAAHNDSKQLQWPSLKADLVVHRKAEDARQKAAAEAAEAARTQAKLLAHALVPMFAAGKCESGDCARFGWTASIDGGDLRVQCSGGKCLTDGWISQLPDGTEARTRCSFGDCMKHGWDTDLPAGGRTRTRCSFGECSKNGWDTEMTGGGMARTRCSSSDCFRDGWKTTFPDGRSVRCRCEGGDCRATGATCE